jgi:transposase
MATEIRYGEIAMMGEQTGLQPKIFYPHMNLEQRVPRAHLLRRIQEQIDFNFIYAEVRDTYGSNGNVSIPPPVILKMMLLLVLYNVRSERELMETIPMRLDWLWFLGYDIDGEVPDHSVLSKARGRWGVEGFRRFFERIVWQCVEAGLVDGSKIFVDSSLVDANASNNSVIDTRSLKGQLQEGYKKLEARLEEKSESMDSSRRYVKENRRYISRTDPDAGVVNRGKPKLSYQVHRAVDGRSEVITATETTSGDINEAHEMLSLLESHHLNTGIKADTVVADSKYGTVENFLACCDQGVEAHMPDLQESTAKRIEKLNIFSEERFEYDGESDTYRCPAGNRLKPRSLHQSRQSRDYAASKKMCAACQLRNQCTRNKSGRTIKRHLRQEELDGMREASRSAKAKRDLKMRQHLMERSYARGTWYGFDRARWRRLWRVEIQEYLVSAIQNIQVLLRYGSYLKTSPAVMMEQIKGVIPGVTRSFLDLKELVKSKSRQSLLFGFSSPQLSFIETQSTRYF